MDEYPECEKMQKVHSQSQAIGEFLDWLQHEKKITLAEYMKCREKTSDETDEEYAEVTEKLSPVMATIEQLLAEYFGIDLKKVEQEKRAMLAAIRKKNEGEQECPT